jgi:hypothetical protein
MNTKLAALAVLGTFSLLAAAPQAEAADNGFYLGAGITQTEFDVDGFESESLDDNSFKVIAGFRPLDWLAVEANYIDLGGQSVDDDILGEVSIDTRAVTVAALGILEVGVVDIYARAGFANWQFEVELDGESASDDGWEPTYGVGVGAHFGSLGVRAEYETFSADDLDIDTLSLSFTYTFL